ncbi:hypothetical protein O9992_19695 [Vibrio lentus]|nr:hypothetical protein [Vibrio lentus]
MTPLASHRSRCLGERYVAAVIVERQAAFGHIINQLVAFYRTVHIVALARCRSVMFSSGRFSRVFLPLARRCCRHGNGDGLQLLPFMSLSVAVYVKVTSLS